VSAKPPPPLLVSPRTNSLAVGSLVAGIAGWSICPVIGALVAVPLGTAARRQISGSGELGGRMAIAGLILGYIELVAIGLFLLWWLGAAILMGSCPAQAALPCGR
jgi:hypothetical protein